MSVRARVVRGYPIKAPRGALYACAEGVGKRMGEVWLPSARVAAVVAILMLSITYVAVGSCNPFVYYRF